MSLVAALYLAACTLLLLTDARALFRRRPVCIPAQASAEDRLERVFVAFIQGRASDRALMDAEQAWVLARGTT